GGRRGGGGGIGTHGVAGGGLGEGAAARRHVEAGRHQLTRELASLVALHLHAQRLECGAGVVDVHVDDRLAADGETASVRDDQQADLGPVLPEARRPGEQGDRRRGGRAGRGGRGAGGRRARGGGGRGRRGRAGPGRAGRGGGRRGRGRHVERRGLEPTRDEHPVVALGDVVSRQLLDLVGRTVHARR